MPRYRALLLDVMGTLVYEPFFVEVPRALGMSLEELIAAKHPRAWVEFELGAIDEEGLRAKFFKDGRPYDHERMKAAMAESYRYLEGVEPLLAELKARGAELHLFSNYPSWYQLIEAKTGLSRYAAWSFVSCHTGLRKPAAAAYEVAARTLGARPEELLFVDDREENCAAARALGMAAIRFVDAGELRLALAAEGVL
jgi:HAD superfamily hydrolase (TIGR01509 family)